MKKINLGTIAWTIMGLAVISMLARCASVGDVPEQSLDWAPKYIHVFSTKCPEAKNLCKYEQTFLPVECNGIKIVIDTNGEADLNFTEIENRQLLAGKTYQFRDYR